MKTRRKIIREKAATVGSANVFADLGIPNPEQELPKAELTLQIHRLIERRNLTQAQPEKSWAFRNPRCRRWPAIAPGTSRSGAFSIFSPRSAKTWKSASSPHAKNKASRQSCWAEYERLITEASGTGFDRQARCVAGERRERWFE